MIKVDNFVNYFQSSTDVLAERLQLLKQKTRGSSFKSSNRKTRRFAAASLIHSINLVGIPITSVNWWASNLQNTNTSTSLHQLSMVKNRIIDRFETSTNWLSLCFINDDISTLKQLFSALTKLQCILKTSSTEFGLSLTPTESINIQTVQTWYRFDFWYKDTFPPPLKQVLF